MVVPGVGVYNAASGLATAYACSSPVLLVGRPGQPARHRQDLGLLHDVHDQLDIVRPITKWAERVLEPHAIPAAVRRAFFEMATGRPRPTEIEIPPETFIESEEASCSGAPDVAPVAADPEVVDRPPTCWRRRRRPLVIAGGGVVLGGATEGAARRGRAVAVPGGHHPGRQGRHRRPQPALRRDDVGQPLGSSRSSTPPTSCSPSGPGARAWTDQGPAPHPPRRRPRPDRAQPPGRDRPRRRRRRHLGPARCRAQRAGTLPPLAHRGGHGAAPERGRPAAGHRPGRDHGRAPPARACPRTASWSATRPRWPTCATCTIPSTPRGPICRPRTWARSASATPPPSGPRWPARTCRWSPSPAMAASSSRPTSWPPPSSTASTR